MSDQGENNVNGKAKGKGKASAKSSSGFSETEMKFIATWFKHLTSAPEADWDAIAKDLNYDNVMSARKYFGKMKTKHGLNPKKEDASGAPTKSKTPVKKRTNTAEENEGDTPEESPKKKTKGSKA